MSLSLFLSLPVPRRVDTEAEGAELRPSGLNPSQLELRSSSSESSPSPVQDSGQVPAGPGGERSLAALENGTIVAWRLGHCGSPDDLLAWGGPSIMSTGGRAGVSKFISTTRTG